MDVNNGLGEGGVVTVCAREVQSFLDQLIEGGAGAPAPPIADPRAR